METVLSNSMWIVGSGEQINMWTNNWLGDSLLSLLDLPASLAPSLPEKVSSIITNGQCDLPQVLLFFPLVTDRIIKTIIPIDPLQDHLIWLHSSDGDLSSKHAYAFHNPLSRCPLFGGPYLASKHPPFSLLYLLASYV